MADPGFTTSEIEELFGPEGKVRALLAVEASLAQAQGEAVVIPRDASEAIRAACEDLEFDAATVIAEGWEAGTPILPILARLRAVLPSGHHPHLHLGSTTQDIVDTALMWRASQGIGILAASVANAARTCAVLAREHRATAMTARTFLQAAQPTTFGARAADWLNSLTSRMGSLSSLADRLPIQMGGPVGIDVQMGGSEASVTDLMAQHLGLSRPASPWQTDRQPVVDLGVTIAAVARTAEKIAADLMILTQSEVGEARVREGGSSAMSHKHNPVDAMNAIAAGTAARGNAAALVGAAPPRLERDAGDWPVEWDRVGAVFGASTAAVRAASRCLESLEINAEKMEGNLRASLGDASLDVAAANAFIDHALARFERNVGGS